MRTTDMQALVRGAITPFASVEAMFSDITGALNATGVFTRLFCHQDRFPNGEFLEALLKHMKREDIPMFMIGVNAKDQIIVGKREDGTSLTIHDVWPFPLVTLMVDHPAYHLQYLKRIPDNCVVTTIDEGHLAFLDDLGIRARTRLFCPHGGPEPVFDMRMAKERPIDILFSGNISAPADRNVWLEELANRSLSRKAALREAYEAVYEENAEIYLALKAAFARHGENTAPHILASFIKALDEHVMQHRRLETLKGVTDHQITILGEVSPEAAAALSHHDLRGATTYVRFLKMAAESKILLNSRKTFARGAHERIFYGLSRGTVVVTDASTFLEEDFERGLGMVKQPEKAEDLDKILGDLLNSPALLDRLRAQGLETYRERHTWRERMNRILPAVKEHLSSHEPASVPS